MEMLQMLKFSLKQDRLSFTKGILTPEADLVDKLPDDSQLLDSVFHGDPKTIEDAIAAVCKELNDDHDDEIQ